MKTLRVALTLVLIFCWATITFAAEQNAAFKKEIVECVQEYRQAFKAKDIDGIMAMYAEDAVLMGTGPGERFVGQDEIRNAHMEYFKTFDKEESTLTWYKMGKNGDVVWISGMTHISSFFKNNKHEFAINWTSILSKQDGAWKFVQRHISNISCE